MKELVKKILSESIKKAGFSVPQNFSIETPPKSEMGDFATNAAMILAGKDRSTATNPREIAEQIGKILQKDENVEKIEIAGPGFINIFLKNSLYLEELKKIVEEKENYGRGSKKKKKINVEYVSANPTGPLHVGNARSGPIGESLANLFSFLGHEVEREFLVNDMGVQIERFGRSLYHWYAIKIDDRREFPEGGYPGEYIKIISEEIQKEKKDDLLKLKDEKDFIDFFVKEGLCHTIKSIRQDCELIGIKFDVWSHESDIVLSGKSTQVVEDLKARGYASSKEGALWFKNPADSELIDKESVLVKSEGSVTYFTNDIAYHIDKINRGSNLLIDVWGSNHHGHIPRLKAAMRAFDVSDDRVEIILYQYVRLKNAGKVVSMGKRLGNFVTLRQVIESGVAPDAFKYFILSQNPNTPFDFDLKLAADTSEKNPVFYIKYAHARICSILKKTNILSVISTPRGDLPTPSVISTPRGDSSGAEKSPADQKISRQARDDSSRGQVIVDLEDVDLKLLKDSKETALYKELVKFPELLDEISQNFQIQALPHFAYKIATLFHDFYANCQVLTEDKKLTSARLSLILAAKSVLSNCLSILGIEAPEHM